ncbi:MAG: MoxR family ATPase [Chitinophagales bacterium]|nr:MoxR family ATPase [Chitinophagales bacterium]
MSDVKAVDLFALQFSKLKNEIGKVIIGQNEVVDQALISLFCGGNCLLIGVPGLAKTKLIQSISQALDLSFKRIQFTPDLMPSDIVGTEILDSNKQFIFNEGPIFANLILADEINRTPPKTQSALLEAMQEKIVTVSGKPYRLPNPFFVMATQNPIEQEGTYPLPEAQLDRFMYSIMLDYPNFEEEIEIVKSTTVDTQATIEPILTANEILEIHHLVRKIPVTDNVYQYAVGLVARTRPNSPQASELAKKYIAWGAGPRASQYLILAAKCIAISKGKYSPDIEDVQQAAFPVLNHRIFKNYQAEADEFNTEMIIQNIL